MADDGGPGIDVDSLSREIVGVVLPLVAWALAILTWGVTANTSDLSGPVVIVGGVAIGGVASQITDNEQWSSSATWLHVGICITLGVMAYLQHALFLFTITTLTTVSLISRMRDFSLWMLLEPSVDAVTARQGGLLWAPVLAAAVGVVASATSIPAAPLILTGIVCSVVVGAISEFAYMTRDGVVYIGTVVTCLAVLYRLNQRVFLTVSLVLLLVWIGRAITQSFTASESDRSDPSDPSVPSTPSGGTVSGAYTGKLLTICQKFPVVVTLNLPSVPSAVGEAITGTITARTNGAPSVTLTKCNLAPGIDASGINVAMPGPMVLFDQTAITATRTNVTYENEGKQWIACSVKFGQGRDTVTSDDVKTILSDSTLWLSDDNVAAFFGLGDTADAFTKPAATWDTKRLKEMFWNIISSTKDFRDHEAQAESLKANILACAPACTNPIAIGGYDDKLGRGVAPDRRVHKEPPGKIPCQVGDATNTCRRHGMVCRVPPECRSKSSEFQTALCVVKESIEDKIPNIYGAVNILNVTTLAKRIFVNQEFLRCY